MLLRHGWALRKYLTDPPRAGTRTTSPPVTTVCPSSDIPRVSRNIVHLSVCGYSEGLYRVVHDVTYCRTWAFRRHSVSSARLHHSHSGSPFTSRSGREFTPIDTSPSLPLLGDTRKVPVVSVQVSSSVSTSVSTETPSLCLKRSVQFQSKIIVSGRVGGE